MEEHFLSNRHPFVQLVFIAGITIITFFVVMVMAILFGLIFLGMPLESWVAIDISNPETLWRLKYIQITQSMGLFVLPPLVIGWLMLRSPARYLSLHQGISARPALLVIFILIAALPVINLLMLWNQEMRLPQFLSGIEAWMLQTEEKAAEITTAFLSVNTFGAFLVNILMVAVIPALGEEFFFRGMIQPTLQRWFKSPHLAILLTAVIFSAFHLQFYGFLPRLMQGLLFGYLLWWSGNLWYPVIGHFVNNLIPVTLTYLFPEQFDPARLDEITTANDLWLWSIAGAVAVVACCIYFYRLHLIRQQ
ncbi:MAG: CPBP family intramembrane glutamic endopeptidase [Bacteroidales bacterium]